MNVNIFKFFGRLNAYLQLSTGVVFIGMPSSFWSASMTGDEQLSLT